jgi:uncharacterized protein YyaL (SSP411 family)
LVASVARADVSEVDFAALARAAPFVEGKVARDGAPTAYVCERGACQLPTHDPAVLASQLGAGAAPRH